MNTVDYSGADVVLSLNEISVVRGSKTVVHNFSGEFGLGVTSIIGPNGAGKSSILQAIVGLVPLIKGAICFKSDGGVGTRTQKSVREYVSYLAQAPDFPQEYSVAEMLRYSAWVNGVDFAGVHERLRGDFGLDEMWNEKILNLSGGMKQRAFIAQALVKDPSVLLLDEPTVAVDATNRGELRTLIKQIATKAVVIVTSHLPEDIELMADRVVVMDGGRSVFDGTNADLLTHVPTDLNPGVEHPVEAAVRSLSNSGFGDTRDSRKQT